MVDDLRSWLTNFVSAEGKLSAARAHEQEANRLEREARPVCGNCDYWMTRQCPREKNVNGRNRGPSMNGIACSKYAEARSALTNPQFLRDMAADERAKAKAALTPAEHKAVVEAVTSLAGRSR